MDWEPRTKPDDTASEKSGPCKEGQKAKMICRPQDKRDVDAHNQDRRDQGRNLERN